MSSNSLRSPKRQLGALFLIAAAGIFFTARYVRAQAPADSPEAIAASFEEIAKPFLNQNCIRCHDGETSMAGVRIDLLNGKIEERHIDIWEAARKRIANGTMPPKSAPQPSDSERERITKWIDHVLEVAQTRPSARNGIVRRLTVAQYRNTLRDLLMLEDDVAEILPADAVSKDGFLNNHERLELSPLLTETYFEIAERALGRVIVDPKQKPSIQNFRLDFGTNINPDPISERLILGAGSTLLTPEDFTVSELKPVKPFPFEPFFMRTKHRFIEGYQGNATVRGWREFDSIYHSVFADFRGSGGYPKGKAYGAVPEGLTLRPAIPNDEVFGADGTYGPKANFKIALRELPDDGRFRVTVTAARYNDGLLLEKDAKAQPETAPGAIVIKNTAAPVTIPKAGIYQVDLYPAAAAPPPAPDTSRLTEGLAASWSLDGDAGPGKLTGEAKFVDSPFGKAVNFSGETDTITIPGSEALNVGGGEFTVAGWIKPGGPRNAGVISAGGQGAAGWYIETEGRGALRFATAGPGGKLNGRVGTGPGVVRPNAWTHVAVSVKRGSGETRIYANGFLAGRGTTGPADLTHGGELYIGTMPASESFLGDLDEFRIYKRALDHAEIQGLVLPGKEFAQAPQERPRQIPGRNAGPQVPDVALNIGGRQFTGGYQQAAFLALRLEAGTTPVSAAIDSLRDTEKIVLTPLPETHEHARSFLAFEKRAPKIGVHLGFRRDCGSSLIAVGEPQVVSGGQLQRFVFEGAVRNYPNPDVEKDNVNYLAGVREIGVRSEYTDGRDMPRLLIRSVEFEGPLYDQWPPAPHRNIFGDERNTGQAAHARRVIRQFAARAYRRPVTPAEESALYAVYQKAAAAGRGFQDSVKDALLVTLTSPQFLFLVESSATPGPEPLDNYELASKLSYFLWNSPPDQKAMQLAAAGTLRKQLDAEVNRMIADGRFSRFLSDFTPQWLSLDKFQVLEPDRRRYPKLTRDARSHLKQEPVEYLRYLIANNMQARNLIQSDFVVANEAVAGYYDLGDRTESGFQFVPIKHGREELGGLLTQAAVMAGLSDGRESNPVKRGAWLARKIIAEPPADPPPNVPALKEETANLTLRQRLEQHRDVPACRQCHAKIDPWGIAMEEFDAGGRVKTQKADARTTLPDNTEISGANELKRYLAEDRIDQVAFSMLKHLTIYASGRSLTYAELNHLKKDGLKLKDGGYRMQDMLRYVVNSPIFLEK